MRPSFLLFLAIGLGLMGYYWWSAWSHEEETVARIEAGPVRGCASDDAQKQTEGECKAPFTDCLAHTAIPAGVCSMDCAATTDCPEHWCCIDAPKMGRKMCAPPTVCLNRGAR